MDKLTRLIKKFKSERGQALVEMALVLPLLLLLLWGIIEFGRIGHAYLAVTQAAREGARLGVVGSGDNEIFNEVHRRSSSLLSDRLTVQIYPPSGQRYTGDALEVEVTYTLDLYMPIISAMMPNPYPVTYTSIMRVE